MRDPKSKAAVMRVYRSKKDEQRIAAALGGKRLPASGAKVSSWDGKSARGDLDIRDFWVEQKSTDTDRLSLQVAWLHKVWEGAQTVSRKPAVSLTLRALKKDFVLVPLKAAQTLQVDIPEAKTVKAASVIVSGETLAPGQIKAFSFEVLKHTGFSLALEAPPEVPVVWVLMSLEEFSEKREAMWRRE